MFLGPQKEKERKKKMNIPEWRSMNMKMLRKQKVGFAAFPHTQLVYQWDDYNNEVGRKKWFNYT